MKIEISKFKRYNAPDSPTKAFANITLVSNDYSFFIENLTLREITKDGNKKLIVGYPQYKVGDSYREVLIIKGQLYWDISNALIERYVSSLEEAANTNSGNFHSEATNSFVE